MQSDFQKSFTHSGVTLLVSVYDWSDPQDTTQCSFDTDLEIVVENTKVRFARILKSDKAPLEAKYRVTGNIRVRARDEEDELPVQWAVKDGILTEILKPDRPIRYPIRIDPTVDLQVGANTDDCCSLHSTNFSTAAGSYKAGHQDATNNNLRSGARFTNVTIPKDATIDVAYLTIQARSGESGTTALTNLMAEDTDDAATFSDLTDFNGRARTAAVAWDSIAGWTTDADYNSVSIVTPIQTVINRAAWASGNALVVFWENDGSDSLAFRNGKSYETSAPAAPKLHIEYTVKGRSWGLIIGQKQ